MKVREKIDDKEVSQLVFLVVDDDGQVRDILVQYLRSFDFNNIIEAKDGKSALRIIQDKNQRIDFIISDWEMPHVDGLTLLRAVRKDPLREHTKFMMVTSQGSRERMKITKAAKSRVDAYIVKPFRAQLFREKVTNLIYGRIDKSVAEFEASIIQEVGGVSVAPGNTDGDTNGVGEVMLDKEAKGKGVLTHLDTNPPENYDLKQMNEVLILRLARAYNKVKWFNKCVRLCTDAHFLFPKNADILFQLAAAYYGKGESPEAQRQLERLLKIDAYHVEAHTLLGEIKGAAVA